MLKNIDIEYNINRNVDVNMEKYVDNIGIDEQRWKFKETKDKNYYIITNIYIFIIGVKIS